jgi:ribose transport system ATP-binding protein
VLEITDRITVLRDGRTVGTAVTADASASQLVEMIIGRQIASREREHHSPGSDESAVKVENLTGPRVRGVSFDVGAGEILGLTGLMGSGFEAVPYLVFDAIPSASGRLSVGGQVHDLGELDPSRSLDAGIALLPGDRREAGVDSLPLMDNVLLPVLERYRRRAMLDRQQMSSDCRDLLQDFDVRPATPTLNFAALSGGNQQKALLAKWLQVDLKLLIVHEPTQGVDVGAREQIVALLREKARTGIPVICASSDYEQIASICDRALIFGRGDIVDELRGEDVTKSQITDACLRSASRGAIDGLLEKRALSLHAPEPGR